MTPEEAYKYCNETGKEDFIFTKNGQSLKVVFCEPYDIGEVYVWALSSFFLVQQFYDGWEAAPA